MRFFVEVRSEASAGRRNAVGSFSPDQIAPVACQGRGLLLLRLRGDCEGEQYKRVTSGI